MNLYRQIPELKARIANLISQFPELETDAGLRADMLDGETDITAVLDRMTGIALDAAAIAEAIGIRSSALSERKTRFEMKEEAMRRLMLSIMDAASLQKMQLTEATLSVRYIAPKPIVGDASALPDHCVRIERRADMKAIKADIDAGKSVPGTSMSNGYSSLTIRVK